MTIEDEIKEAHEGIKKKLGEECWIYKKLSDKKLTPLEKKVTVDYLNYEINGKYQNPCFRCNRDMKCKRRTIHRDEELLSIPVYKDRSKVELPYKK